MPCDAPVHARVLRVTAGWRARAPRDHAGDHVIALVGNEEGTPAVPAAGIDAGGAICTRACGIDTGVSFNTGYLFARGKRAHVPAHCMFPLVREKMLLGQLSLPPKK